MKLLEKILVADDFVQSSDHLLDNAIQLANVFDSTISLIHVLPEDIENDKVKAFLHQSARDKLEESAKRINDRGVATGDLLLKTGSPYEQVARAADQEKVNLVVTGSGEKADSGYTQLGTTTKRVIQQCRQPVFVVKKGQPLQVKKILCPIDLSKTSLRALKNAITAARRFEAELLILHVVELPGTGLLPVGKNLEEERETRLARQREKLERFLADLTLNGLSWRKEVRIGDPATLILDTIKEEKVDLLIMGTNGRTGLSRWMMGSVAEKVSREVPCSFVMLKSKDVFQLRLETRLNDLESQFQTAQQLVADGFFEEAIETYKVCLTINSMHVPAYYGIAKVYEKMGKPKQASTFRAHGKEILEKIWDTKIEEEVRQYYSK